MVKRGNMAIAFINRNTNLKNIYKSKSGQKKYHGAMLIIILIVLASLAFYDHYNSFFLAGQNFHANSSLPPFSQNIKAITELEPTNEYTVGVGEALSPVTVAQYEGIAKSFSSTGITIESGNARKSFLFSASKMPQIVDSADSSKILQTIAAGARVKVLTAAENGTATEVSIIYVNSTG